MLLRPVTLNDHAALLDLARQAGYGFTSLPQDAGVLEAKIIWSEQSFAGVPPKPREHRFLMVLEDPETGKIVGSTGVKSHVGLSSPFYSYKLSTIVQANRELEIYSLNKVLHMVNDYTGASEIGSLFLTPEYRRDGLGSFLSRSRFLMLAEFPTLFDKIIIAEMRGVHDAEGNSHFYDNIARHFFQMPFKQADYINATKGGQFIADLMPKYPIYVTLLPQEAREVIGVVNEASLPALKLLEREGFTWVGYVDIFDAGPTVRVDRERIATVKQSRKAEIAEIVAGEVEGNRMMLASTQLARYRMTQGNLAERGDGRLAISQRTAEMLQVRVGDPVRFAA
jgi:arginine N-succinyltransferase